MRKYWEYVEFNLHIQFEFMAVLCEAVRSNSEVRWFESLGVTMAPERLKP